MSGRTVALGVLLALGCAGTVLGAAGPPNVVLIITDDQGYGDLGIDGNTKIRTPNIDRLARESVRLEQFHVSPVCAPTRSSLLTGRYNYRTGVTDTFLGRAMMRGNEVTLAEMLGSAGYHTAIFGKWHLGDNYPMRPGDQGFSEALVLRGGGIGQASGPPAPGGGSYFDPILQHNNREVATRGYCSDVYTDAAIDYIDQQCARPFFVYLAFNAPHGPLQVADHDYLPYKQTDLSPGAFPEIGQPLPAKLDRDSIARIYGMVSNIDQNVGRLLDTLDRLRLTENTIVIFLTDNGPASARFNAGMRGLKASVYEGGIRVPCFIRWPGRFPAGRIVDRLAAHIDIAPTLLEACGVPKPKDVAFDGKSLMPLLSEKAPDWPDRTLFFQWHRGDFPERYRAFAARTQRYKLLRPEGATRRPVDRSLELYDVEQDPFEFKNLAEESPEIVGRLRAAYDAWFDDVTRPLSGGLPRIVLGAPEENPSTLTRQDWRGPKAGWAPGDLGSWDVEIARPGEYEIGLKFEAPRSPAIVHLALRGNDLEQRIEAGETECKFAGVALTPGPGRLEASIQRKGSTYGASYVDVSRIGPTGR